MQTIPSRFDFSRPPPGYDAARHGSRVDDLAAAWADHKTRHDPPGLRTRPWGGGVFCFITGHTDEVWSARFSPEVLR